MKRTLRNDIWVFDSISQDILSQIKDIIQADVVTFANALK